MILEKTAKLLLLSILLCSAIIAVSIATIANQRTGPTTTVSQEDSTFDQHPRLTSGDPVGGGGTPRNETGG